MPNLVLASSDAADSINKLCHSLSLEPLAELFLLQQFDRLAYMERSGLECIRANGQEVLVETRKFCNEIGELREQFGDSERYRTLSGASLYNLSSYFSRVFGKLCSPSALGTLNTTVCANPIEHVERQESVVRRTKELGKYRRQCLLERLPEYELSVASACDGFPHASTSGVTTARELWLRRCEISGLPGP